MTTRNLTDKFKQQRKTRHAAAVAGYDTSILLPPWYVRVYTDVVAELRVIDRAIASLRAPPSQQFVDDVGGRLSVLTARVQGMKPRTSIERNVQRGLARMVKATANEFQNIMTLVSKPRTAAAVPVAAEADSDSSADSPSLVQVDLLNVEDRHTAVVGLCANIDALAQVFSELRNLIVDQGSIIDRIDYNMEEATERTSKGLAQLQAANTAAANSGKCWCRCTAALVILIVIMLVVLVVRVSTR
jgi:hypothetical protein